MTRITEKLAEFVVNSKFCYGKEKGEGFINKDKCKCNGNLNNCKAYQDKVKFLSYFDGLTMKEVACNHSEIIEEIKVEFKESQWFKGNVKV